MNAIIKNINSVSLISIFILVALFIYLPFFIYIPTPLFSMDTFGYFWVSQKISLNELPIIFDVVEFPIGYSLFIHVFKTFNLSILSIVTWQVIIYVFSSCFLIFTCFKKNKNWGIASFFSLIIFAFLPTTIGHNLTLYTESFYSSVLIFLVSALILYFNSPTVKNYAFILLCVLLSITIRSNGLITLAIPIVILIVENKNTIQKIILIFLIVFIPQVSLNLYYKHEVSFSESNRIKKVLIIGSQNFQLSDNFQKPEGESPSTIKEMYKDYLSHFYTPRSSFYFSKLPVFYEKNILEKRFLKPEQGMFDAKFVVDKYAPGLKKYIFGDYDLLKFDQHKYKEVITYDNVNRSKWMYIIHLSYEFLLKTKGLIIIYLLFLFFFLKLLYNSLIKKEHNWLVLLIVYIHIASLILLPFIHSRVQARYISVSEFIVIFASLIFILESTYLLKFKGFIKSKFKN